jgi:predicted enzyme related to lactoylglutathione lyase/uncharacterized protein YecT (DUF1311 family)
MLRLIYFFILSLSSVAVAQLNMDAKRLSSLEYMKYADKVNCEQIENSVDTRVCYNLKFQNLDSILNNRFTEYLQRFENDSLKQEMEEYQMQWIENRRLQSKIYSEGYRGAMLGIRYLSAMNDATRLRTEELEKLMDFEDAIESNSLPMENNHINYIEFKAKDLEVIKEFYRECFGWKFTDYGPDYVSFEQSGVSGGFVLTNEAIINGVLVVLYHNDLELVLENVITAGGKIIEPIFSFPGGRRFHFTDPAGNELAIWSDK